MTLLRVENGDTPLSTDEKLNEIYLEEFSTIGTDLKLYL